MKQRQRERVRAGNLSAMEQAGAELGALEQRGQRTGPMVVGFFFFFFHFVCLPVLRQGLFTQSGVASNPRHFSCLSLPSVEMIGVRHHAWLELVLKEGVQLNGTLSQSKIYVHSGIYQRLSV